ncbi:MAG: ChbG/HpnK family deacetylase [Cyanobacteria bacterium SIG31]|nr:ChbG/HpnK family deacetylase [Cyanobacteria bacterium SIG31]
MAEKKFILNADDFGLSKATNRAVIESYSGGILKSVSIIPNGAAFDEAINSILPQCPELSVGIHLNITDGSSLCEDLTTLTDTNWKFKNNYWQLLLKAYNPKEKEFLEQVEREFRRQIEKVMSKTKVTHIDSHQHIHSIPPIFNLVCRLAKEYGIKHVRTHFEKFYLVPDLYKHLSLRYLLNILKTGLLGLFTIFNESTVNKYGLKTNDYIVGIIYASLMDALVVAYGAMSVKYKGMTVEAIVHPRRYDEGIIDKHFNEFLLTKNKKLKDKLEKLGYEITNYDEKES